MALEPWEIHLFKQHNIVALRPLHTKVQLFDVMVKKKKMGKHPVLLNINSLLYLQSDANNCSEWKEVSGTIKAYLDGTLGRRDEAGFVDRNMDGSLKFTTNHASGVLVDLLELFHIKGAHSKKLSFEAHNVNTEAIDRDLKMSLFNRLEALWVPNLEKIQGQQPLLRKNGDIELWVVTEMKYCTNMIIESGSQASGGGSSSLPAVLTGSIVPIDGGIQISTSNNKGIVLKGDKVPIGFKALKLEYDCQGKLKNLDISGGDLQPSFRDDDDDDDDNAFDPDKDPCYHMADLFLYEDQELVACLEIE